MLPPRGDGPGQPCAFLSPPLRGTSGFWRTLASVFFAWCVQHASRMRNHSPTADIRRIGPDMQKWPNHLEMSVVVIALEQMGSAAASVRSERVFLIKNASMGAQRSVLER